MRCIEIRIRLPFVDLRVLAWLAATIALAWHEWQMARMDHRAPPEEWLRRVHKASRCRAWATRALPGGLA